MNLIEEARAELAKLEAMAAEAEAAALAARIAAAKALLQPVMTDYTGKPVADAQKVADIVWADADAGLAVFHINDGSDINLGVQENPPQVWLVTGKDNEWTRVAVVHSLAELGMVVTDRG